jgi:hypothetical protein
VRGQTTQNDIVVETKLQDFKRLVRPKAVTNQHAWFLVSTSFGLWVKYTLKPLEANLGVGVSRSGACIVPSRGGERGLVASMGNGWPDNHW